MSRIIKFRVWDKKNNNFWHNMKGFVNSGIIINANGNTGITYEDTKFVFFNPEFLIVQQFTGLTDKNKREIYEGDIIIFMGRWDENGKVLPPDYEPYEIAWCMGGLKAFLISRDGSSSIYRHNECLGVGHTDNEVIGNIFENPELLNKNS